ncbi:MAG: 23S rRNA (pseudouridine(1915)-N(3))-methyltransferase RlmH [Rhodobacteraceae bacterium]|nr:23S rRNA (pseudouridine(1915)-N(3))-methyltransferase RlmH [Paracoccaceae bacterium]
MKITILAVNKMRSGPELEITNRYIERFNGLGNNLNLGPVNIVEIEPNDKKPKHLNCLNDKVCLLDERGVTLSSCTFANKLASWRDSGFQKMTFAIGGALGKTQLPQFDPYFTLGFGPMVFPHFLARVMLVEQLYRAASILNGMPYHKN